MIDNEESGLFYPQNKEYVKTSEMVKLIAEVHGKKLRLVRFFNPIIKPFINRVSVVNKVFGNLVYEQGISLYSKDSYQIRNLKETIELTEKLLKKGG